MLRGSDTRVSLIWNWRGLKQIGIFIRQKDVSIVNTITFRLVKNVTFLLFTFAWILACLRLWWGTFGSIWCQRQGCDDCEDGDNKQMDHLVAHYCWMQTTYTFPNAYPHNPGMPGIGQPPPNGKDGIKHAAYYPWVPYVLFLQSLIFIFPAKLWSYLEGSRILHFKQCGPIDLTKKDVKFDNKIEKKMQILATVLLKHQKYGLNFWYSSYYIMCEVLNLVVVVFNLWFTNLFLAQQFGTIGPDILARVVDQAIRTDVLSFTFPKVTKCIFRMFGPGGGIEERDYLCVIPINEAYEKTYILMWFWLWIVCVTSAFALFYRAALMMSPALREYDLAKGLTLHDQKTLLPVLLKNLNYWDWFVLKLVSTNFNMIRFGLICGFMKDEICGKTEEVFTEVKVDEATTATATPGRKYEPVKRCSDFILPGDT